MLVYNIAGLVGEVLCWLKNESTPGWTMISQGSKAGKNRFGQSAGLFSLPYFQISKGAGQRIFKEIRVQVRGCGILLPSSLIREV